MSDPGPFGDDPFKGMPFFGDLAKMLSTQGPVSWEAAGQLALSIASGGESEPNVDPMERITLEQLARVAELQVTAATGLNPSATGRGVTILPVTRTQWVQHSLDAYKPLFEHLATSLTPDPNAAVEPIENDPFGSGDPGAWLAPLMAMIGPMMLGMTAGSMLGHLSRRSFGQYDLPVPRPESDELLLVVANLDEFGAEWSLPAEDLRLWVCLHELTHHAVLNVPHVRARLERLLTDYVSSFDPDPGALESRLGDVDPTSGDALSHFQNVMGDPEALLGAVRSPAQVELLPRLEALVAVIVGYVDHVMDQVGGRLIGSYEMVTEALRRRRVTADESDRFVERLLGLELGQDQYERGEAFIAGIVQRAGAEVLERLWADEADLPTPAEITAPGLWLARIGVEFDLPADLEVPDDLSDLDDPGAPDDGAGTP
ncbi:MAG: zinc-dependent metalloprotease [Acidimicrobiales bacterium]|nr:zinc-dependent metalloprotease [Acidimicrobiales bacterium]